MQKLYRETAATRYNIQRNVYL